MINKDLRIFSHPKPIRFNLVNSTILVPVVEDTYADEYDYEEIPAKTLRPYSYRLCVSPLIVRDLNVDDVILADDNGVYVRLEKDKGAVWL